MHSSLSQPVATCRKILYCKYMEEQQQRTIQEAVAEVGDATNDATSHDTNNTAINKGNYVMSVLEAVEEFAKADLPVSKRTVQRYAERNLISAIRVNPDNHEESAEDKKHYTFLIDPSSLEKQFARMRERRQHEHATSHDTSRQDATSRVNENNTENKNEDDTVATSHVTSEVEYLRERVIKAEAANDKKDEIIQNLTQTIADNSREVSETLRKLSETNERMSQLAGYLGTPEDKRGKSDVEVRESVDREISQT